MNMPRIFPSTEFMQASADEPVRSVIVESSEAVVVAWHVKPGKRIPAHVHPSGQDTWIILSGRGQYQADITGEARPVKSGDVVVAYKGSVHGVCNDSTEPLQFISVISPSNAGYELARN